MVRLFLAATLCLAVSVPAFADEPSRPPRLVPGGTEAPRAEGARFTGPDTRAELFASGGLRLGAVLDSTPVFTSEGADRPAFGGYAAYVVDSFSIGSSLRSDATASAADLSASYVSGLGTTALSLGYEWAGRPASFSINPLQMTGGLDAAGPLSDLSLSLSFTHDVTPAFHLGGFAAATRSEYEDRTTEQGFRVGAGLGYRF